MNTLTTRQQLHNAVDRVEEANAILERAQQQYNEARDRVNGLIDRLLPLPSGEPVQPVRAKVEINRFIQLIKAVRSIPVQYDNEGRPYLGLKDTKDVLDEWLAVEGLR